jgi:hypothetical protein
MRIRGARRLYSYWREAKGDLAAPRREAIAPRAMRDVLPWVFILDRIDRDVAAFRLAGTGLCDLYGKELKDRNFLTFWLGDCQRTVRSLIDNVVLMPAPGIIEFEAKALNGRVVTGEIVLLPLIADDGEIHQILGGWFPSVTHDPLLQKPLMKQTVTNIRVIGADDREFVPEPIDAPYRPEASLKLVVSNGDIL